MQHAWRCLRQCRRLDLDAAIAEVQAVTGTHSTLGLARVRRLLARLGNPQTRGHFIHVGGTNGKGSVTAMLEGILRAAGYRVGAFISPHLRSYTERYRINGRPVAPAELSALLDKVILPHLVAMDNSDETPTEFEAHTAAALCLFAARGVDPAVLEVGLGGRLDATNVVIPEVTVITNVSVDHTAYLGGTVREIAGEKAGIIKQGVPVVTAAEGEALDVIEAVGEKRGAPLILVGRDVTWDYIPCHGPDGLSIPSPGQMVSVQGRLDKYIDLFIPLWGPHQRVNAACAVAAAEVLAERGWDRITHHTIRAGLGETSWHGRFEIIPGRPAVILDGAHNAAGAAALAAALRLHKPREKFVFVLGILDDKEKAAMAASLVPLASTVVVTRPPGSRAGGWREPARILRDLGAAVVEKEDPLDALNRARSLAGPDGTVVVAGSLYLVGVLRAFSLHTPA